MKRLYTLVFVLAAGGSLFAQQVVLTLRTHGLSPGPVNEMKSSGYIDPGPAGRNKVWDLSSMGGDKDFRSFVAPAGEADKDLHFPEANVVLNEEENEYYYHVDDDAQMAWGAKNACGRVVFKFRRPLINMRYPFTYGDEISGNYEGTYYYPNTEAPLTGTYHVKADGYGKLILPGGKVISNVLRVVFTHSYDVLLENGTQTFDVIAYRWYCSSERFPLAIIIGTRNSTCNPNNYSYRSLYRLPQQTESLAENTPEPEQNAFSKNAPDLLQNLVSIYPNPVSKQFTLEYTVNNDSKVFIELYDNLGSKIAILVDQNMKAGSYSEEFNTGRYNLQHGIYHIRSLIGDQSITTTFIKE